MIVAHGIFIPGPPHVLRGGFTIREDGGALLFETNADFYFDGSPAPGFGFHTGIPTSAGDLALRANMSRTRFLDLPGNVVEIRGQHAGPIPPAIDLGAYDALVLWCFETPFILGYGTLERL
ncbi:hypothetical protein [Rhizobium sp. SAFR-030]|uniref:hypothetical protein n=1 Tax=Rhizobium sp. SAFR-030 TaxID=3387277 RepID=UPI003F7E47E1